MSDKGAAIMGDVDGHDQPGPGAGLAGQANLITSG